MSNGKKTVLIFGIGKLGGPLVDVLSARYPQHQFVLISRNKEISQKRATLSQYLCLQWGLNPVILSDETDLYDVVRTAELIYKYQPDVVLNATTPFPWWKIDILPIQEKKLANEAGPGVWCALDCVLPLRLTEALSLVGSNAIHINACYPDMTNAFLSSHKCAPRLGIGNISNLVPGLQLGFANHLSISPKEVEIRLVGHHYVSWNAPTLSGCEDAQYDLTVFYPNGKLHFSGPDDAPFAILRKYASRIRGLDGLGVTIGSAATLIASFLGSPQRQHHSPGANGLPGGYPVHIDFSGEVKLNLPKELSVKQAIAINEKTQVLDGIDHVEAGKVLSSPKAREAYSRIIGAELPAVTFDNITELALDTLSRLNSRFNLNLNNSHE